MQAVTRFIDWLATPYSLYLVIKDSGIHWTARVRAGSLLLIVSLYIINPFDIIPDIHPLIGWLDDLVIIPLAMTLADKIVPEVGIVQARTRARADVKRVLFRVIVWLLALVLLACAMMGLGAFLLYKLFTGG